MEIRRVEYRDIAHLHGRMAREAGCQVVHYSILPRGLADPYALVDGGSVVGYCGVWNRFHPGRLVDVYLADQEHGIPLTVLHDVVLATGATEIEAQTNMPMLHEAAARLAVELRAEKILFEDGGPSTLESEAVLRRADAGSEDVANVEWVLDLAGTVVARGGMMSHYNPPYWDLYMEVVEAERGKGFGSFILQELKKVCHAAGRTPAARCDPDNVASRRALEKAGFVTCGTLVAGEIGA